MWRTSKHPQTRLCSEALMHQYLEITIIKALHLRLETRDQPVARNVTVIHESTQGPHISSYPADIRVETNQQGTTQQLLGNVNRAGTDIAPRMQNTGNGTEHEVKTPTTRDQVNLSLAAIYIRTPLTQQWMTPRTFSLKHILNQSGPIRDKQACIL